MRILIDTNILISREGYELVEKNLQELSRLLIKLNHQLVVHPASIDDLQRDKDETRKSIQISKFSTYPQIEAPPNAEDENFLDINNNDNSHDKIDLQMLYSVWKNAVDFLITEDRGIHKKSESIGIDNRILDIDEALEYFKHESTPLTVKHISPPAVNEIPMHNIDLTDPFFDSLKAGYSEFPHWWSKCCKEGRKAWVYRHEDKIGAILIYKIEDDPIDCNPIIETKKRLKICTLKVSHTGYKIGELFLKFAVAHCVKCSLDEIYLTHFTEENDYLVQLIEDFGFVKVGLNKRSEDIFIKKLIPDTNCDAPLDMLKKYYPSFYDGELVRKFIVPIWPKYHHRLFTDYRRRQLSLAEFDGGMIIEGNTIRKAYLSHSRSKQISIGDIVIFYRSIDEHKVTSIGVVEKVIHDLTDASVIRREVGKRSVYTDEEINLFSNDPTKVILFSLNFHFPKPIHLNTLKKEKIIIGNPYSLREIKHHNYEKLKKLVGLDEKFCRNSLIVD
ncbi:MAG: hypothetical protein GF311_09805 [Candidatus Lokiarchaeota archaeon]|nr:hypothetical protein [Candidatus Lokiarchaeota archaeon]